MTKTTYRKANSLEAFLWASMGKSAQITISTQQTLSDLLEIYANGHHGKTDLYRDVAARLSKVARKEPAWKEDYIQAVAVGTKTPSKRFARAVEILAATIDGIPAAIADTEPVLIHARPGTVQPGALLVGESVNCHYPPCMIHFIPTHPRMIYCPLHRDPKTRR